ncbi:PREDICTED: proteasomal ubiquitin receptor ADRM1-like isoform X2 [Nicrophorus vespilloides]|uniref:Proteasomal ubiquitin receptor ADRM1-like isoform X2 n=1 Tax=Nicrophorus vespilloides TaxID=110193 RepID=A0ABM1MWE8_NICVS|nr:PREDICTED: proteasomal ubiquitin receptor ADRM1-like isoform X2 [Nicrophorus vespilloides]
MKILKINFNIKKATTLNGKVNATPRTHAMSNRGALFGSSATGPGSTGGNKHLVEMRAGKMNLKGHTVYPDKRKGLLYVYQSDDSLMHFCWQDRTTGVVEDDLIIFPDDCEYVKVPQCTTGRVYLLKFKSSNRRFFFWLQEPRADKDEDNCKRINEYLNNPAGSVQTNNAADQDLQSLLNNMSQSQLMQLLGGGQMGGLSSLLGTISRPSTGGSARTSSTTNPPVITHHTEPKTPTTTSTNSGNFNTPQNAPIPAVTPSAPKVTAPKGSNSDVTPIQLADLQNYLQGISPAGTTQPDQSATALNSDALSPIMSNAEALEQLQNHLPAIDGNTQEQLRSTLQSPQFQQAVSQFSSALESGQLGPVVSQLVANPEAVAAANQGNMQEFVKALEKCKDSGSSAKGTSDKDNKDKGKKDDKKDDDDDGMQLD